MTAVPEVQVRFQDSSTAAAAGDLVRSEQRRLVQTLQALDPAAGSFQPQRWWRDGGQHGGGERWEAPPDGRFQRASVNVSVVHFDDARSLASASALSAIVHPRSPRCPSLHLHLSWTEPRVGEGGWRVMADLNPSLPDAEAAPAFRSALARAAGSRLEAGFAAGDAYFWIPALGRARGVVHFYAEGVPAEEGLSLAQGVGREVIAAYGAMLAERQDLPWGEEQLLAQRAYHTLYFFQVLTLDRGTTAGLLAHDQNDLGVLGSLPAQVDPALLRSWSERLPGAQQGLLEALLAVLPADGRVEADEKRRLAAALRAFYRDHPGALAWQAPLGGGR